MSEVDAAPDPESGSQPDETILDIEALLRSLTPEDLESGPAPVGLWEGIEAALADEADLPAGNVRSLAAQREKRNLPSILRMAAAVVVIAALGAGALSVVRSQRSEDSVVLAAAALTYDEVSFDPLGARAVADVALVERGGTFSVTFEDADLPTDLGEDADLELWLIEPDADGQVKDLVSLGVLRQDELGSYSVPTDIDPALFNVVDISIEPRDGDAGHSSRSILRGALHPAS